MLLRDYFNSLNFYKNGELSRNQIGRSGVQVKKENEKFTVVRSRSPQNLKCGHFTLLFCRGRQRNVPKCKTHVQSDCFAALSLPSLLLYFLIFFNFNFVVVVVLFGFLMLIRAIVLCSPLGLQNLKLKRKTK